MFLTKEYLVRGSSAFVYISLLTNRCRYTLHNTRTKQKEIAYNRIYHLCCLRSHLRFPPFCSIICVTSIVSRILNWLWEFSLCLSLVCRERQKNLFNQCMFDELTLFTISIWYLTIIRDYDHNLKISAAPIVARTSSFREWVSSKTSNRRRSAFK